MVFWKIESAAFKSMVNAAKLTRGNAIQMLISQKERAPEIIFVWVEKHIIVYEI